MKISKLAVVALFAAGFITTTASAAMAEDKPEIVVDCAEGYTAEYSEDGTSGGCVAIPDIQTIKPIDSCWVTEDGVNACARGFMPPVKTDVEITPYDAPIVCATPEDTASADAPVCKDAMLYDATDVTGEEPMPIDDGMLRDGEVTVDDPTLMYQSGVPMAASSTGDSSSNNLAALGVLVAALGALGIGISKQRASTK